MAGSDIPDTAGRKTRTQELQRVTRFTQNATNFAINITNFCLNSTLRIPANAVPKANPITTTSNCLHVI